MGMRRVWTALVLIALMAIPTLVMTQQGVHAAGAPKAEWRASKAANAKVAPKASAKASAKAKKAVATAAATTAQPAPSASDLTPPTQTAVVIDQSQEVLDVDFVMAAAIASQGPKDGYASALSDEGVLYDANGASPAGREAATSRFGAFPADVLLVRAPERALAAGGSGSSWGTYTIKRGDTILSGGRYISVWRRETSGWKMISELAAGKTLAPPPSTPISGILPKRPVSLARAAQSPAVIPSRAAIPTPTASVPSPVTEPATDAAPVP